MLQDVALGCLRTGVSPRIRLGQFVFGSMRSISGAHAGRGLLSRFSYVHSVETLDAAGPSNATRGSSRL